MNVVVSQPMYFPWVGLLEQIRLADVFVHYDDVQFARGFFNRVQIKTVHGPTWMTVPLRDAHRGATLDSLRPDDRENWRGRHRRQLREAYAKAPFRDDMLHLAESVFEQDHDSLAALSKASTVVVADYFGLTATTRFEDASALQCPGSSSQRLLDLCKRVGGSRYITGHGARNYLDHSLFEASGVDVEYMDYLRLTYPQQHGAFTPFVSSLDLVANCGRAGGQYIKSATRHWKQFIHES